MTWTHFVKQAERWADHPAAKHLETLSATGLLGGTFGMLGASGADALAQYLDRWATDHVGLDPDLYRTVHIKPGQRFSLMQELRNILRPQQPLSRPVSWMKFWRYRVPRLTNTLTALGMLGLTAGAGSLAARQLFFSPDSQKTIQDTPPGLGRALEYTGRAGATTAAALAPWLVTPLLGMVSSPQASPWLSRLPGTYRATLPLSLLAGLSIAAGFPSAALLRYWHQERQAQSS